MKNYTHKSKYFYGNEISKEEIERGYINYKTLAKCFDAVICNDITKLFYKEIGREYNEPEQVNGIIDNSEEIEELEEQAEEIEEKQIELIKEDKEESAEYNELENKLQKLREQIEELEREQDEQPEIYQYYIINDNGARILQDLTDEIVYYLPALDVYIWGVTHWGTSWGGVYTNVRNHKKNNA